MKELCTSMRMVSTEADNALRDWHDSSDHMKAEFNNCFHRLFKYFQPREDKGALSSLVPTYKQAYLSSFKL